MVLRLKRRLGYLALALGTIALGLVVHFHGAPLGRSTRDILGDALWAAMIVWWVSAVAPEARPALRFGLSYSICVLVETSQAYHAPALDALRETFLGHLVLGTGFDPRDFLAYAIGAAAAALIDRTLTRRSRPLTRSV